MVSVGIEANPFAHFASQVKLDWSPSSACAAETCFHYRRRGVGGPGARWDSDDPCDAIYLFSPRPNGQKLATLRELPPDKMKLLLGHSISPLPLHKTLVLLEFLQGVKQALFTATKCSPWRKRLCFRLAICTLAPRLALGGRRTTLR